MLDSIAVAREMARELSAIDVIRRELHRLISTPGSDPVENILIIDELSAQIDAATERVREVGRSPRWRALEDEADPSILDDETLARLEGRSVDETL